MMRPSPGCSQRRALLLLVILAAMVAWTGCAQRESNEEGTAAKQSVGEQLPPGVVRLTKAQQAAVQLQTAPVSTAELPQTIPIAATVQVPTGEEVQVVAPVQGYVEAPDPGIPRVGARVERGQLLTIVRQAYSGTERVQLQVNQEAAAAAATAAQAQVKTAEAQLERSRRLYRDKIAPLKQVQQDEAAVAKARADYDSALAQSRAYEAALSGRGSRTASPSRFELRAPISGAISAANIAPGQLADAAHPLFSLVNASVIWVRVPVPESQIAITAGAFSALLSIAAYPNSRYLLRRVASTGVVDPATHTLTLIFAAENRNGDLKPGMAATVLLQGARKVTTLVVPESAVLNEPTGSAVFVVASPETFRHQPVTVQYVAEGRVAVQSGVNGGEQVVTRGVSLLESELRRGTIQEVE